MPDTPSFVVNDRRKFTSEGELRHEDSSTAASSPAETVTASSPVSTPQPGADDRRGPQLVDQDPAQAPAASVAELSDLPESAAVGSSDQEFDSDPEAFPDEALASGPTEEQITEAARAYTATVDRLDTAMRAANPGGDRMPEMTFDRLVQSLYTQALMLLGGGTEPGETPRVDILGARQTIDMLAVIAEKSKGQLSSSENKLLESALFDLQMGFLEITQALARQAAQRQTAPGGAPPLGAGPRIVR